MTSLSSRVLPDLPSLHDSIAPAGSLLRAREALYLLAGESLIADVQAGVDLDPSLVDSPISRHHLGEALGGRGSVSLRDLVPTERFVGASGLLEASGVLLRVAADPAAPRLLEPALHAVRAQADPTLGAGSELTLLCESDEPRFTAALETVRRGLALAVDNSPELTRDLLAHVSLVGILDATYSGSVVSASHRNFPGLLLIEFPDSPVDVAEALVHEGAHQKLFDLAITQGFLTSWSDTCEVFRPSWSAAQWPMEQALAACHAYACLAQFADEAGIHSGRLEPGRNSLLPAARARTEEIGAWLLDHVDYLDIDAVRLLNGILDTAAVGSPKGLDEEQFPGRYVAVAGLRQRPAGDGRTVVARPDSPAGVWLLDEVAATILRQVAASAGLRFDEVLRSYAATERTAVAAAFHHLAECQLIQRIT